MRIEEKRHVIEVLLCGATIGSVSAAMHLGYERAVGLAAAKRRALAQHTSPYPSSFEHWGLEAAYRLIESSPTLRREWFGR